MPGDRPQSGAIATPAACAWSCSANSCFTTVLLPPRSAKWHPRFDRGLGQFQVEEVRNRGEHAIVTAHELQHRRGVSGVHLHRRYLVIAREFVDPGDSVIQALCVGIGERDCLDSGAAGHVECRSPAHHACTHYQNFHEALL